MVLPLAVVVLLTALLAAPGIALAEGEPPLADAGLDQTVTEGATVHLDGGGSLAPDGEITAYEWTVRNRATNETQRRQSTDPTWTFDANATDGYAVTLTVTDDAGRSSEDTLYVDVDPAEPPSVSIDGPDEATVGESIDVTASVEPGDAPVEQLNWDVEHGDTVEDPAMTETTTVTPPSTSAGEIRVVVIDTNDNEDEATLEVDVSDPADESSDHGGWTRTDADRDDAVVRGPQVVDGDRPLDATHTLDSDVPGRVSEVTWVVDGTRVGASDELDRTWDPGTRKLYAVVDYRDGSDAVATFADGSRDVLVNPKPEVELRDLTGENEVIDGVAEGTDDGVGLADLVVTVDDELVHRENGDGHDRLTADFEAHDLEDGETYDVTVEAIDEAGQTATVTESFEVVGIPEITRAEFVNDPVDSFHPRIDRDRYAAELVVEIELNGHDAEDVDLEVEEVLEFHDLIHLSALTHEDTTNGTATFVGEKTLEEPGIAGVRVYDSSNDPGVVRPAFTELDVARSDPEVRVKASVIEDAPNVGTRLIEIDASESFDPDGEELRYFWGGHFEGAIGESVHTFEGVFINLIVEDESAGFEETSVDLSNYYNPHLTDIHWMDSGKVFPTENAEFSIRSVSFMSGRGVDAEGFEWNSFISQHTIESNLRYDRGGSISITTTENDGENQPSFYWGGSASVPAESFLYGLQPEIHTHNTENPNQTERVYQLPTPEIETHPDSFVMNLISVDVEFLVMEQSATTRLVDSLRETQILVQQGYSIEETHKTTHYVVEEHIEESAEYETETKTFSSSFRRYQFVNGHSEWTASGSNTETTMQKTTETEWVSSPGRGSATGNTRRTLVVPEKTKKVPRYRSAIFGATYCSDSPSHPGDLRIGSCEETIQEAVYHTEYEVEVTKYERITNTEYFAERKVMVSPAQDYWEVILETTDHSDAMRLAQEGYRMETETRTDYWEVEKLTEHGKAYVDSVDETDRFIQTEVEAEARMTGISSSTGDGHNIGVHQFDLIYDSMTKREEIHDAVRSDINEGTCIFEQTEFKCHSGNKK